MGWPALGLRAGLVCLLLFVTAADRATAAAFLQPQGHGQIVVGSAFDVSDQFFDSSGKLRPVAQYRKFEMMSYGEFGATDALTLIFATSSSLSTGAVRNLPAADRYMFVQGGARWNLRESGDSLLSLQATFQAPHLVAQTPGAPLRREVNQLDVRVMYGSRFVLWGQQGFTSIEAGYRHQGETGGQARLDISVGHRPWPGLLVLVQSFNGMTASQGRARPSRTNSLQGSVVYELDEVWSVQLGLYGSLSGQNTRHTRGVLSGLWRRF